MFKLKSPQWLDQPLRNICITNCHAYVPFVVITIQSFSHSWLITRFVWRVTWRVPPVEHELLIIPEHLLDFSTIHVAQYSVLYIIVFGHCIVIPSPIYDFWLHLWYLQTFFVTVLLDIPSHNWFKKDRYTQTKTTWKLYVYTNCFY